MEEPRPFEFVVGEGETGKKVLSRKPEIGISLCNRRGKGSSSHKMPVQGVLKKGSGSLRHGQQGNQGEKVQDRCGVFTLGVKGRGSECMSGRKKLGT